MGPRPASLPAERVDASSSEAADGELHCRTIRAGTLLPSAWQEAIFVTIFAMAFVPLPAHRAERPPPALLFLYDVWTDLYGQACRPDGHMSAVSAAYGCLDLALR